MIVYVLSCEHGKVYVGKSENVITRVIHHFENNGSIWTRIHKPQKVIAMYPCCDAFDEDKYTKMYMLIHGIENVRGGSYVTLVLSREAVNFLRQEIVTASDTCFRCGSRDHFVAECPTRTFQKGEKCAKTGVE
jgi:hypothetical protein